jgi:hypothetical protein
MNILLFSLIAGLPDRSSDWSEARKEEEKIEGVRRTKDRCDGQQNPRRRIGIFAEKSKPPEDETTAPALLASVRIG